jgi:glycosyltransferase involved in cell wall biosynthesis
VIRPLILVQIDPFGDKISGIKTFIRDFVQFAPEDFAPEIVGCSSSPGERPVGRWQRLEIEGRSVDFLPVLATPDVHHRPRIPMSLQFTAATVVRRSAHRWAGRILQFHYPGVSTAFVGVRAPKIMVVHLNPDDIDRGGGESRWARMPGLLHRVESLTLPTMDRVFVVNRAGVTFYRQRHPRIADRVAFLATSVDQRMFRPLAEADRAVDRAALLRSLRIDESDPGRLVLFVGRLEQQKDPLLAIDAFAVAARQRDDLRLVVAGEGALRGPGEQRAATLGIADRIQWLGFRDRREMPSLMNAVDTLLVSSRFEGMPISVLEALACGLPVVAPSVGEIPTIVIDGSSGRLTPDRTADGLAEGLLWVLDRGRQAFESAALAAVAPYRPEQAMLPFYEAHRQLARQTDGDRIDG